MQISIALRKVTKIISLSPKEKVMESALFTTKKLANICFANFCAEVNKNEICAVIYLFECKFCQ